MGVVGTYTGHRRPDKLVSGSAFEEVREYSAVGREISVPTSPFSIFLRSRKGDLSSRKGDLSSFSVLARSPATQRAHLTNHDHERR